MRKVDFSACRPIWTVFIYLFHFQDFSCIFMLTSFQAVFKHFEVAFCYRYNAKVGINSGSSETMGAKLAGGRPNAGNMHDGGGEKIRLSEYQRFPQT